MPWEEFVPGSFLSDDRDNKEAGATVIAVMIFLSYVIALNTVVPISLYVR